MNDKKAQDKNKPPKINKSWHNFQNIKNHFMSLVWDDKYGQWLVTSRYWNRNKAYYGYNITPYYQYCWMISNKKGEKW